MVHAGIVGAVLIAAVLPASAVAQAGAEAALFSQGHFKGARVAVTGPIRFGRPVVVRSISVPSGSEWELCSGNTFSGCRQFKGSTAAMIMTVRSARPAAAILAASGSAAAGSAPGVQSLRGVASEYFVAPEAGGVRVEVQPATTEAAERKATEFCRARGWRQSAHGRLQTVGASAYLADVLCVDP